MNDQAIRDILIAFLQATNHEIRIFQEKNVSGSFCDVMAVTDKLTGYEIKSDLDNYSRLKMQIKSYDNFFDENYLVVSQKHSQSALEKVPSHWGVLCVCNDCITVVRKAQKNKAVIRSRQLEILWKLEIKNILLKNNMPLFAQKPRHAICNYIVQNVEDGLLGRQIADELMRRDYGVYNAEDYTLYTKGGDGIPIEEIIDMLSERNLEQFTLDQWITLYRQAIAVQEQKEALYKAPIGERVQHAIPYTDIEVSLGAPWISREIIGDFIGYILDLGHGCPGHVEYEPITGNWNIREKDQLGLHNTNAEVKYGIRRYNALYIIESSLNLREIKLHDNGNVYNEQDTLAALEKQKLINDEFKRWIWLDEDRRWIVEEAYNKIFTKYETQKYDGSCLQFPDMSPEFKLYDYQKDAVQKIISSSNTLLAFDVGAGKTFIMIAAAMKMRAEGISRKNLFVVPNHIVGQWEKIFTDLYPTAKVLAIEPKSFKPEMRNKVLTQIRDGDYDGIIMAYSCFEMIPLSETVVLSNMSHKLRQLDSALQDLQYRSNCWNSINAIGREKKYILKLTQEFLESMNAQETNGISFDQLEINTLFLDEAHNYKNLPIRTKLKNLNGINTTGSSKCLDMLHKVRHVQASNGGRGVVFATGTPLCNSISDAYTMQMYLQYGELEKAHLDVFDNWVKTFALPEQMCEIDVDTSKFRVVRRFAKFFNLPELSRMFAQVAIFHAIENPDDIPRLEGYTDVIIPKYPELTEYMHALCDRTQAIRSKSVNRRQDNMLKVSTDGRKAALHLKLVDQVQPDGENSKVCRCADKVVELYHRYPNATQLVFCDYSTPKGNAFNVYDEIKQKLTAKGIPAAEIAFIHHFHTESRKLDLFQKFNSGKVRVLIGSTFKLGIGANVQVMLKAVHHLDVPWRPADMVQREGRILRRGNSNQDVQIYRYIAEGSFDAYSWQTLETKQKFISQFLSGTTYQRTIEDLESNVLTYAQVKALALSEPLMKQLAETENEIKTLQILISKEKQTVALVQQELLDIDEKIDKRRQRWNTSQMALANLKKYNLDAFNEAYKKLKEILADKFLWHSSGISHKILGFQLDVPQLKKSETPYILLGYHSQKYLVEMGDTPHGNARRIINKLKSFRKVVDADKKSLEDIEARKIELKKIVDCTDNTYLDRLAQCQEDASELRKMIAKNEEDVA